MKHCCQFRGGNPCENVVDGKSRCETRIEGANVKATYKGALNAFYRLALHTTNSNKIISCDVIEGEPAFEYFYEEVTAILTGCKRVTELVSTVSVNVGNSIDGTPQNKASHLNEEDIKKALRFFIGDGNERSMARIHLMIEVCQELGTELGTDLFTNIAMHLYCLIKINADALLEDTRDNEPTGSNAEDFLF